jgi:hypothetical protein
MKNFKFLTLVFFCNIIILNSNAQNFSSLNVGKNAGVNGLFTNPASIANSNYKWDVPKEVLKETRLLHIYKIT